MIASHHGPALHLTVKPLPALNPSAPVIRATEQANPYFVLQKRKGLGGGFAGLLVGTFDTVLDSRVTKNVNQCRITFCTVRPKPFIV